MIRAASPAFWSNPARSLRARQLLLFAAAWLVLVTVLPAFAPALAAYGLDHQHLSLNGVVPPHRHPYDPADAAPSAPSCNAPPDAVPSPAADAEESPLICFASSTSDSAGAGAITVARAEISLATALTSTLQHGHEVMGSPDPPAAIETPPPRA